MVIDDGDFDDLHDYEIVAPSKSPSPERPMDGYVEYSEVTLDEKEL